MPNVTNRLQRNQFALCDNTAFAALRAVFHGFPFRRRAARPSQTKRVVEVRREKRRVRFSVVARQSEPNIERECGISFAHSNNNNNNTQKRRATTPRLLIIIHHKFILCASPKSVFSCVHIIYSREKGPPPSLQPSSPLNISKYTQPIATRKGTEFLRSRNRFREERARLLKKGREQSSSSPSSSSTAQRVAIIDTSYFCVVQPIRSSLCRRPLFGGAVCCSRSGAFQEVSTNVANER